MLGGANKKIGATCASPPLHLSSSTPLQRVEIMWNYAELAGPQMRASKIHDLRNPTI